MFAYQDPVGGQFGGKDSVRAFFQQTMQSFYDSFGSRRNSGFTWVEAFAELSGGQQPAELTIDWRAFPLLASGNPSQIDSERFLFQDEYVEWRAERDANGQLTRVTFCTELPEYLQAFAAVGFDALAGAVQEINPGASPTTEELYGVSDISQRSPEVRSRLFRTNLVRNPWNNGTKGILCLTQRFNTMSALFNLVTECGVEHSNGSPGDTCGLVGGACGVGRSSDPRVCSQSQSAVRSGFGITLKDSAGIRIVSLEGAWKIDGQPIDINDPASNQGVWEVSRNGRQAVLDLSQNVTLANDSITTGAQVSRVLVVGADVLAAPESTLPDWAKLGNEHLRQP